MALVDSYLIRWPDGHRELERAQVRGAPRRDAGSRGSATRRAAPFYYRVHSPVILIELDHHPGILLDNDEPEPFHVHTIVRIPNGGDYGMELVRARGAAG